jgi:hypothetical protein
MPVCQKVSTHSLLPLAEFTSQVLLQPRAWVLILVGALPLCSTIQVSAQEASQPQSQTAAAPAEQKPADQSATAPPKVPGLAFYNLLEKKSIVFPDIALNTERLSPAAKFQLFVDNSISVHVVTWAMIGASVGQADDSPTGFGEGWDAYAKRFGSSMGRQASTEFFATFVLASALHEDPRFYAEINPSFSHAVKYSVKRVFITRSDDGRTVANMSGLVGPALSEGLANVYWPDRNRTVGDTLLRYGLDLAGKAGGNMLRDYWPVFYAKLHHTSRPASRH